MDKLKSATDTFIEVIGIYLIIMLSAAALFCFIEDKTFFESLWWASATAMTVGYGDIYPATVIGKILAMVLMHVVPLGIVPLIIVRLTSNIIEDKNQFTDEEQKEILALLREILSKQED